MADTKPGSEIVQTVLQNREKEEALWNLLKSTTISWLVKAFQMENILYIFTDPEAKGEPKGSLRIPRGTGT